MRKDVGTMTRAELLGNARAFLLCSAGSLVAMAGIVLALSLGAPEALAAVSFFAVFFFLGGLIGGLYFLIRGLLRPASWRPGQLDWAMRGFSPEDHLARLVRMICREVPGASPDSVTARHCPIKQGPPADARTSWQQFVQSTSLIQLQHQLSVQVMMDGREVTVTVLVGRSTEEPTPLWCRLLLEASCPLDLLTPVRWTPATGFEGGRRALSIEQSAQAVRLVRRLARGHHRGMGGVVHAEPALLLEPGQAEDRVLFATLPAEVWGGFSTELGLRDFMALLEALRETGRSAVSA
ncbi:MAG: hypothetical protein QM767_03430 [Anaeromyxobacter sp.]